MATQRERREITRATVLKAARDLFGKNGFQSVSMDDVGKAANVAKGGLYHHFPTKTALFEAVMLEESSRISRTIQAQNRPGLPFLTLLLDGCRQFFDLCEDDKVRRILLIDGPSIVGAARWREIDAENFGYLVQQALDGAIANEEIAIQATEPLTTLLLGAISDAVIHCGNCQDYRSASVAHLIALENLIVGLGDR